MTAISFVKKLRDSKDGHLGARQESPSPTSEAHVRWPLALIETLTAI